MWKMEKDVGCAANVMEHAVCENCGAVCWLVVDLIRFTSDESYVCDISELHEVLN